MRHADGAGSAERGTQGVCAHGWGEQLQWRREGRGVESVEVGVMLASGRVRAKLMCRRAEGAIVTSSESFLYEWYVISSLDYRWQC